MWPTTGWPIIGKQDGRIHHTPLAISQFITKAQNMPVELETRGGRFLFRCHPVIPRRYGQWRESVAFGTVVGSWQNLLTFPTMNRGTTAARRTPRARHLAPPPKRRTQHAKALRGTATGSSAASWRLLGHTARGGGKAPGYDMVTAGVWAGACRGPTSQVHGYDGGDR